MAKTVVRGSFARDDIKNRIKDEQRGIQAGNVDLNSRREEKEPVPDVSELGLPLPVRRQIAQLAARNIELGSIIRDAEKDKKQVSDDLKKLLETHVDVPSFSCDGAKVTVFSQTRESLKKDILRTELLNAGVKPQIVAGALEAATEKTEIKMLKVTAEKGAE